MAEFGKDAPVGKSFEVYAADDREAAEAAYNAANVAEFRAGQVLYVEQIEAGKWEVVLAERPDSVEELIERIDAWFVEARANPDPETRALGAVALLGKAVNLLREPRKPEDVADTIKAAAVVFLAKTLDEQGAVRLRYADFANMDLREEAGVGIFLSNEDGDIVLRHTAPVKEGVVN